MFMLSEFVKALALLMSLVFNILYIILVVRIIISWVGADPYNEIVRVVYSITEPILAPFRRLPLQMGAIDFSPILAFLLLSVLQSFVMRLLYQLAARIG